MQFLHLALLVIPNLIEIWQHKGDSFTAIEVFEFSSYSMTCVNELYRQDMQQEVDYIEDFPDQKDYLIGIRSQAQSNVPKSARVKKTKESAKRIKPINDIQLKPPNKVRTLLTAEEINKTASIKLGNHGKPVDWANYLLSDLPELGYRHAYFYGTKEGRGGILELILRVTPNMVKVVIFT